MAEMQSLVSKVSKTFPTHDEAEAFHDGINVALGLFPPDEGTKITIGYIFPVEAPGSGYTTTITRESEYKFSGE
jgi:hypothetical protein